MSERYMDKARQRGCMRPFFFVACALVGRNTTKYLSPTLVCSFTQSIQNRKRTHDHWVWAISCNYKSKEGKEGREERQGWEERWQKQNTTGQRRTQDDQITARVNQTSRSPYKATLYRADRTPFQTEIIGILFLTMNGLRHNRGSLFWFAEEFRYSHYLWRRTWQDRAQSWISRRENWQRSAKSLWGMMACFSQVASWTGGTKERKHILPVQETLWVNSIAHWVLFANSVPVFCCFL